MFARLLLIFIAVPLIELYLLLRFKDATNIPTTIAVVLLTGIVGSMLASRQGAAAIRNFQLAISQRRAPGNEVIDGILIVFAAAMLLTPGLLTDTLGFLLLIPATRAITRRYLIKRYAGRFRVVKFNGNQSTGGTVDAEFQRTDATGAETIDSSDTFDKPRNLDSPGAGTNSKRDG